MALSAFRNSIGAAHLRGSGNHFQENGTDGSLELHSDLMADLNMDLSTGRFQGITNSGPGTVLDGSQVTIADALKAIDDAVKAEETARAAADTAIQAELDASQSGAGLSAAGAYIANTGANFIASSTSLADADDDLDTALKAEEVARVAADAALQTELDASQVGAGLDASGGYVANGSANYIASSTSLKDADDDLDAALKAEETARAAQDVVLQNNINAEATARAAADSALQAELDASQVGAGLDAAGAYVANGSANYIAAATSLADADDKIDAALKAEEVARIAADSLEVTNRTNADAAIQTELDAFEVSMGSVVNASGVYQAFTGKNYINGNADITEDLVDLDAAIKAEELARIAGDAALQTQINNAIAGSMEYIGGFDAASGTWNAVGGQLDGLSVGDVMTVTVAGDAGGFFSTTLEVGDVIIAEVDTDYSVTAHAEADFTVVQKNMDGVALQAEVDAIEASMGGVINAAGVYQPFSGTNFMDGNASLTEDLTDLDTAIKAEELARVAADAALQTELDASQVGAGLDASGGYVANGSANYIPLASSLKDADDKLDAALKAEETARIAADSLEVTNRTNADAAIQAELDASQVGAGLDASGGYVANGTANYISAATSLKDADDKLDAALKVEEQARVAADAALQTELDASQVGAGLDASGGYVVSAGANYIAAATSLKDADDKLDTALKAEETARIAGDAALQTEIDAVEASMGPMVNAAGVYQAFSGTSYIDGNAHLAEDLSDLDGAISTLAGVVSGGNDFFAPKKLNLTVNAGTNTFVVDAAQYTNFDSSGVQFDAAATGATGMHGFGAIKTAQHLFKSAMLFVNGVHMPLKKDSASLRLANLGAADAVDFAFNNAMDEIMAPAGVSLSAGDFAELRFL